jgi:hypothetical protein
MRNYEDIEEDDGRFSAAFDLIDRWGLSDNEETGEQLLREFVAQRDPQAERRLTWDPDVDAVWVIGDHRTDLELVKEIVEAACVRGRTASPTRPAPRERPARWALASSPVRSPHASCVGDGMHGAAVSLLRRCCRALVGLADNAARGPHARRRHRRVCDEVPPGAPRSRPGGMAVATSPPRPRICASRGDDRAQGNRPACDRPGLWR